MNLSQRKIPPILYVIAAVVLFSTGGLFIKLTSLSAYELSFGRSMIGAMTVALLTRHQGFRLNRTTGMMAIIYAALLLLFVMATKLTTAANAIFLQYTAPLYMLVLEPVFYKERFRRKDFYVVGFCLLGMVLFFVGKLRPQDVAGNVAALASGVLFALFTLLLRHPRAKGGNNAASVIYGNLLLAIVMFPIVLHGSASFSWQSVLIVLYMGVFQIGVAYTLFTLGIARGVRSLEAGIIGYIEPLLNPLWVFLVIGERPSQYALLGGAIIISAVVAHTLLGARSKFNSRAIVSPD